MAAARMRAARTSPALPREQQPSDIWLSPKGSSGPGRIQPSHCFVVRRPSLEKDWMCSIQPRILRRNERTPPYSGECKCGWERSVTNSTMSKAYVSWAAQFHGSQPATSQGQLQLEAPSFPLLSLGAGQLMFTPAAKANTPSCSRCSMQ